MITSGPDLFTFASSLSATHDGVKDIPAEVREGFERLALLVIRKGYARYSADAILHQLRWEHHIERGDREFKCNNNWTSALARWFMARHPEHDKFFETRSSPHANDGEEQ